MRTTIAVDCMGGDLGPLPLIEGALSFIRNHTATESRIVLVGDETAIRKHLEKLKVDHSLPIEIQHAPEIVEMDASPTEGIRRKNSSIAITMKMLKESKVSAVISAGNTGAVMANAVLTLGRLKGVSRPAIAALFPNKHESYTLILDVGANVDVKPENILQFAQMGASYAENILKVECPRVGLLSIGEEATKGNELTVSSHELLRKGTFNFIGNVEGRDILEGSCNVVVCDGFVGNIMLKFVESVKVFLETRIRKQISSNNFSRLGALLMGPFLRRIKKAFDYAEYGGAPLLGINGNCVIAHGSSSSHAINNAIKLAYEMVATQVNNHIEQRIEKFRRAVIEQ